MVTVRPLYSRDRGIPFTARRYLGPKFVGGVV